MMACSIAPEEQTGTGVKQFQEQSKLAENEPSDSSAYKKMNGIHHRPTPAASSMISPAFEEKSKKLSQISEHAEYDDPWDNELSAEAQAHNISMFLSSTSDSGDEHNVVSETVITDVYKDPLDYCMEGIEDLATGILRTGRLVINGAPGDMTKVQPALFNLQASDKEMPQLIPQMLQHSFFYQTPHSASSIMSDDDDDSFIEIGKQDEVLANGWIRLALPVDTAIYVLLRSHCAKGARQAEELINTIQMDNYTPAHNLIALPVMPPIIKFHSTPHPNGQHLVVKDSKDTSRNKISCSSSLSTEGASTVSSKYSIGTYGTTSSSSLTRSDTSDSNLPLRSDSFDEKNAFTDQSSLENLSVRTLRQQAIDEEGAGTPPEKPRLEKTKSRGGRKHSVYQQPSYMSRSRGDSTGSDTSSSAESRLIPSVNHWRTKILENHTIIAQYGSMNYPLVWWEPSFKIDFRLSTSVGLLSGMVMGIDSSKPEVTLKVFNNTAKQVGFAIRSYRQSTVFKSHVVYPKQGLEMLGPYKSWEDNVEFYPNDPNTTEMFTIDLFFCTMDTKPVWNVIRKYAIMKAHKSNKDLRRVSKRRPSHLHLPGTREQKEDNLKLVLAHGLQCVVKGHLDEAEIIFSHALYLPDLQRLPLKAFVYICLAVIANKRLNQGHSTSLIPVMKTVEASSKLVAICEQGPGSVKMPRTIQLVKQLKKELNIQKIMKEKHKKIGVQRRGSARAEDRVLEESGDITEEGGELTFKDTKVTIPPQAVKQVTKVTISSSDTKHFIPMLKASGWEKIVQIFSAVHIECSPPLDKFERPLKISTVLPDDITMGSNSLVRLMHSNFLRHWEDITDCVPSRVSLTGNTVNMETNLSGWLAVSMIQFDASMIAQMVLKSISIEPIMLRISTFGFIDVERKSVQIAVFVVPCKQNEEPIHRDVDKPENFSPISFPHVIQAYPNERLRMEIVGSFEPDRTLGETNLMFEMDVQQRHNQIHTKWVKTTSASSSDRALIGKLNITSCRNNTSNWEDIANISLSAKSSFVSSSPSSSSEQ